ncbi:MAG: hypothetical protein ACI9OW_000144 [Marinobacter psychrophilus]
MQPTESAARKEYEKIEKSNRHVVSGVAITGAFPKALLVPYFSKRRRADTS